MIRVAVAGCAGRMGKTLVQAIEEAPQLSLGAAFEHPGHSFIGADAGTLAGIGAKGILISADPESQVDAFDVVIDFTIPEATLGLADICARNNRSMVIGTTGLTAVQLDQLEQLAKRTSLFISPNMSVGVNLSLRLIELAAKALGDDVDVEVIEAHHRHKVDAPSGTALRIGEVLAKALGRDLDENAIYGRQGITGARDSKTIGFSTIRGGDIVGEHTVMFAGEGERLEITHRAHSRSNFAQGALRAVGFVHGKEPGLYNMQDLLGL
jgi:4-hydroxy-tetrahydrodipicolinate reductase|tara:strand:+ start:743 stop:1543 length:801 start_codon:yes stop_codon:yes gene_type:complete